jgi:hypothetical protein
MKDKPPYKPVFSTTQLLEINSAAWNVANSAMFEAGLSVLGDDKYVSQEEGALPVHIKQLLKVIPVKYILNIISEQETKDDN